MPEPLVLTDDNLDAVLAGDRPVFVLVANGGVRGDFASAFNRAPGEQPGMLFATLDPARSPRAAARFAAGDKPLLVGWLNGAEVVRRSRPWASDLTLALEQMEAHLDALQPDVPAPAANNGGAETPVNKETVVESKPVAVTDATFEAEVLAHSHTLPVVVDFWAPWCGPCRMVAPILDKLAQEFAGKVRIAKVNTDENPGLSQAFQIMSIPTIMMVKERTIVFSQPGALPESALRDLFQQLIDLEIPEEHKYKPGQQEPAATDETAP